MPGPSPHLSTEVLASVAARLVAPADTLDAIAHALGDLRQAGFTTAAITKGHAIFRAIGDPAAVRHLVSGDDHSGRLRIDAVGGHTLLLQCPPGVDTDHPFVVSLRHMFTLVFRVEAALAAASEDTDRRASLTHDLKQPLSAITANLDAAQEWIGAGHPETGSRELRELFQDMQLACSELRNSLDDAHTDGAHASRIWAIDPKEAMRSAVATVTASNPGRCTFRCHFDEDIGRVAATSSQLFRIFSNLLVNAVQAMPKDPSRGNAVDIFIRGLGEEIEIVVRDNGPGIPQSLLRNVFQPFVSTKQATGGTGLGLAFCRRAVEDLKGHITVRSKPDQGAAFHILLPIAPQDTPRRARVVPQRTPSRPAKVLIIDDEELPGRALERLLRQHDVTRVRSGSDALRTLASDATWDLVFLDLMMPGMHGMDVFSAIEKDYPQLAQRVVIASGGATSDETRAFLASNENPRLDKPFAKEAVQHLVSRAVP